ncbi:MAG: tetratricopeptide repeat protein [Nitrospiraceae bacterium]
MSVRGWSIVWVLLLSLLLGGLQACSSLPRVVVLHDPLTPTEHVTLGLTYEAQGRTEVAVREYRAALEQGHGYVPAFVGLGNLAFGRGALEEAEAYYHQALAVAPQDPGANNNLAMLYLAQSANLTEAERLARQALVQGGPLRPYVLDTMVHIYMRQGRYQEAKAALEEAEAMTPSANEILHERLVQSRRELATVYSRAE